MEYSDTCTITVEAISEWEHVLDWYDGASTQDVFEKYRYLDSGRKTSIAINDTDETLELVYDSAAADTTTTLFMDIAPTQDALQIDTNYEYALYVIAGANAGFEATLTIKGRALVVESGLPIDYTIGVNAIDEYIPLVIGDTSASRILMTQIRLVSASVDNATLPIKIGIARKPLN